ncbi:NTP transferase domain-containing protein [Heliobacillus mobilis]|uniref:NTP transferase domain-containing protein n=1 Tax=Heliobacterium mobile TaxID=28064 RepID=A0A6I3SM46_HELMO|nr:nucleotidyltransferase family protein [Heliobacterium mobile]MTV49692.1 NTP transferase domain-containing protein [Heliobacterium mobile]
MHAVVLAGGFGTRLRSVVNDVPKPMAPIHSKPFLDYILGQLKKNGIKSYTFCLHYMADAIQSYYTDGRVADVEIDYSLEASPLGTGGAIGLLRDRLRDTFCVVNADTYLELNVREMIQRHRQQGATASIALFNMPDPQRYGRLALDREGRIVQFNEKSGSKDVYFGDALSDASPINAGLYLLEPEIFEYIPRDQVFSLEKDLFPQLLEDKKVILGYDGVENFFDIGVPEDLSKFRDWVMESERGALG